MGICCPKQRLKLWSWCIKCHKLKIDATYYREFSVNLDIDSTSLRVKMLVVINYSKNILASRSKVVIKSDTGGV